MTEIISDKTLSKSLRLSFFFWMTVVMSALIFGGFGLTYWQPMAGGSLAPLPPIVHIHGFLFSGWMLLLMVQAFLVNVKNIRLHRSLGTFGISMGTLLWIFAAMMTILPSDPTGTNTGGDYFSLEYLSVSAVVLFGVLFTLAIRNVRTPDNHRRYILFAIIPLLPPGINRLYMVLFDMTTLPLIWTYLTMDALVAAILFQDWRTRGKLSSASITGAVLIVGTHLLHVPITGSETFAEFCMFLGSLSGYR
jgi:hypothetical protein